MFNEAPWLWVDPMLRLTSKSSLTKESKTQRSRKASLFNQLRARFMTLRHPSIFVCGNFYLKLTNFGKLHKSASIYPNHWVFPATIQFPSSNLSIFSAKGHHVGAKGRNGFHLSCAEICGLSKPTQNNMVAVQKPGDPSTHQCPSTRSVALHTQCQPLGKPGGNIFLRSAWWEDMGFASWKDVISPEISCSNLTKTCWTWMAECFLVQSVQVDPGLEWWVPTLLITFMSPDTKYKYIYIYIYIYIMWVFRQSFFRYVYIHSLNSLHIDRSFAELIALFHAVLCSESACLASRVIALGRPFQVRCLLCLSLKQGVHHLDTYRVLPVALVQYPAAKGQ